MPVVWASRLLGERIPEKVSGSDLIEPLAQLAAERGYKIFLLGGAEGVAGIAARRLTERHPGLKVVGTEAPQIDLARPIPPSLVRRIRDSGAQLLLVAFGAPKQELFIRAIAAQLGPCVAIGVGASLDFIAGRAKRAPSWVSRSGLEWLYRLAREPRRLWRRYLVQDPAFVAIVFAQLLAGWRRTGFNPKPRGAFEGAQGFWAKTWDQIRWRTKHALDLALLIACVLAGSFVSHSGDWIGRDTLWFAGSLGALWVLATALVRHYDLSRRRSFVDDIAIVSVLVLLMGGGVALGNLVPHGQALIPSTGEFLRWFWPLAIGLRLFYNRRRYRPDHAPEIEELVVLGTNPRGRVAQETVIGRPEAVVLGFIPMHGDEPRQIRGPILGPPGSLEQVLREFPVTEVIITGNVWRQGEEIQEAIRVCERFGVNFALPVCGFRLERARPLGVTSADGYQHFSCVRPLKIQLALKRLIDILGSSVGLLLLSPLMITAVVLVKLTSKGPIFFRQVRSGLHGRQFHMLKFRSMVADAEKLKAKYLSQNEQSGPVFKLRNDPRVTRVGAFLRKYSIDELPQLINVLRGEMSLVGPRPPVPSEVSQYKAWQRRRLSMRPGLTCTWQVGGRNNLSFNQWMYLDMGYIDQWNLGEDFRLLLRTIPVVFSGKGAS
jgi:exopolysaccharide biosynthesis polyprenyl glycosylphosphotransferase